MLWLVAHQQDPLAFLLAEPVSYQAKASFTAVLADSITTNLLTPAFEGSQADAELSACTLQAGAISIRLADQIDHATPVRGSRKPFQSFRSTSNAAISAMAFSLRCISFLTALISLWS